jgi:hypothetical protein
LTAEGEDGTACVVDSLAKCCCWKPGVVAVVLVLAAEEREKLKLALVDRVRPDCSEFRDTER